MYVQKPATMKTRVSVIMLCVGFLSFWSCTKDQTAPFPSEPIVEVSDEAIYFGKQAFGETAEQTFVIRNMGMPGHMLHLYYYVEDEENFSITDPDQEVTIASGDAWQARVRFHAMKAGSKHSRIILFMSYYPLAEDRDVKRRHIQLHGEARQFCPIPGMEAPSLSEVEGIRPATLDWAQ